MLGYVIYIDELLLRLLANFFFEFILLWATAEVTRSSTTRLRLALGSLVGTIHYLLYLLASYRIIPFYGLLRFLPTLIFVSIIMLLVTFYPHIKGKQFMRVFTYFYGIGFISAGAGVATAFIFGSPTNPKSTAGMLVSTAVILIIAELGWGIVQKRIYHHIYQLPIRINFNHSHVKITGLIDTGNKLKDPLTQQPVIVVEEEAILPLFDSETANLISRLSAGNLDAIDSHSDPKIAVRLRIIPFNSIGSTNGVLVGFRPDSIDVITNKKYYPINNAIVAIYQHQLDQNHEYHALLPPELLHEAQIDGLTLNSNQGGESHHAT